MPAGIKNTGHNGGVDFRGIAFENAAAVHHGDAGDTDVVLDGQGFSRQRSRGRAFDIRPPVPGPERVVFRLGPIARCPRIGDRQARLGEFIQTGV